MQYAPVECDVWSNPNSTFIWMWCTLPVATEWIRGNDVLVFPRTNVHDLEVSRQESSQCVDNLSMHELWKLTGKFLLQLLGCC